MLISLNHQVINTWGCHSTLRVKDQHMFNKNVLLKEKIQSKVSKNGFKGKTRTLILLLHICFLLDFNLVGFSFAMYNKIFFIKLLKNMFIEKADPQI